MDVLAMLKGGGGTSAAMQEKIVEDDPRVLYGLN